MTRVSAEVLGPGDQDSDDIAVTWSVSSGVVMKRKVFAFVSSRDTESGEILRVFVHSSIRAGLPRKSLIFPHHAPLLRDFGYCCVPSWTSSLQPYFPLKSLLFLPYQPRLVLPVYWFLNLIPLHLIHRLVSKVYIFSRHSHLHH